MKLLLPVLIVFCLVIGCKGQKKGDYGKLGLRKDTLVHAWIRDKGYLYPDTITQPIPAQGITITNEGFTSSDYFIQRGNPKKKSNDVGMSTKKDKGGWHSSGALAASEIIIGGYDTIPPPDTPHVWIRKLPEPSFFVEPDCYELIANIKKQIDSLKSEIQKLKNKQ
jgi:hypothetical protein